MAATKLEPITSIPTRVGDDAPDASLSGGTVDHGIAAAIGTGFRYAMAPPQVANAPAGSPPPLSGQTLLAGLVVGLVVGGMWMASVVTEAKAIATEAQRAGDDVDRRIREVEGKVGSIESKVGSIDDKQDRMATDVRSIREAVENISARSRLNP